MSTLTPEAAMHVGVVMPPTPTVPSDVAGRRTLRILIAGAGGTIGSAVAPYLAGQGHTVVRLVRREPSTGEVCWDPDAGTIDAKALDGFDAVVHVASLPMARWTPAFMQRWRANHVGSNRLLAEALARRERRPRVLVCASAQGVYADSGDAWLMEGSPAGTDELASLLLEGERATQPAVDAGIRVVHLRIPTVLGGTSLAALNASVRRLGSGRQWFSWMGRDELASIVGHVLVTGTLAGPVNACSPHPVRNAELFATLGRVLGRKPWLLVPAFMLRLMMGGMADGLILASRRLAPKRLLATGYAFRYARLEAALRYELKVVA